VPTLPDNSALTLTFLVGLYANAVLIASNLWLHIRLRSGPPRPKRSYRVPSPSGQRVHAHELSPATVALVRQLIREIELSFMKSPHEMWERLKDPAVPEIVLRPYSEGQEDTGFANLETPEVSIQWHRMPGNFTFADRLFSSAEWAEWYEVNLRRITSAAAAARP